MNVSRNKSTQLVLLTAVLTRSMYEEHVVQSHVTVASREAYQLSLMYLFAPQNSLLLMNLTQNLINQKNRQRNNHGTVLRDRAGRRVAPRVLVKSVLMSLDLRLVKEKVLVEKLVLVI